MQSCQDKDINSDTLAVNPGRFPHANEHVMERQAVLGRLLFPSSYSHLRECVARVCPLLHLEFGS